MSWTLCTINVEPGQVEEKRGRVIHMIRDNILGPYYSHDRWGFSIEKLTKNIFRVFFFIFSFISFANLSTWDFVLLAPHRVVGTIRLKNFFFFFRVRDIEESSIEERQRINCRCCFRESPF